LDAGQRILQPFCDLDNNSQKVSPFWPAGGSMSRASKLLHACVLALLFAGITNCGSISNSASAPTAAIPFNPSSAVQPNFAFWYESWNPSTTPTELRSADVVIGLDPSAISAAHSKGKLVLPYHTYYQAVPNSPLLINLTDLANVGFQINQQFLPSVFGGINNYVMCPRSAAIHQRVQQLVQRSLSLGYDGLFVDNTFIDPAAHAACDSTHAHISGPDLGGAAYLQLLAEVRQIVKARSASAMLISNPGNPDWADQMSSASPSLWDLSDLVLWESYGYTSFRVSGHDVWDDTFTKSFRYVNTLPDKAAKLLVLSYPETVAEARYSFAAARIFGFNWTANLGKNQQNTTGDGGHFGVFFAAIPYQIGNPVEQVPNPGLILNRKFEHGEVFVNTDASTQTITAGPGTIFLGATTVQVSVPTNFDLPPRVAAIVISP
jgi:hypothetical protein